MSEFLRKLRQDLHTQVDGAWARPEGLPAKDALSAAARNTGYAKCLRDLWDKGAVNRDAYKACMRQAKLDEAYRSLWGKGGGAT